VNYRVQWALLVLVLMSAIGVEYMAHQSRQLFSELQRMVRHEENLRADWGRLLLEMSTWGAHSRVEKIAREKLAMEVPGIKDIEVIQQ
jgi:cell division protein FtsL